MDVDPETGGSGASGDVTVLTTTANGFVTHISAARTRFSWSLRETLKVFAENNPPQTSRSLLSRGFSTAK